MPQLQTASTIALTLTVLFWGAGNSEASVTSTRLLQSAAARGGKIIVSFSDGSHLQKLLGDSKAVQIRISPDHKAAGWVLETPFGTETQDVTTGLEILFQGKVQEVPVINIYESPEWHFRNGSKEVVYLSGPLHGGGTYTLYDLIRHKVISTCDAQSEKKCPSWTR